MMRKILCAMLLCLCLIGSAHPAMLTIEEIEEIYEKEKTPFRELFTKISLARQKEIVAECATVTVKDIKDAEKATDAVVNYNADPLGWTEHHAVVLENLNLVSRRRIAQKYGIKAGDTFTLESAEIVPNVRTEALGQ